jgi:dipeptidyl aminopeptidase/acylaminoacyl peptidase
MKKLVFYKLLFLFPLFAWSQNGLKKIDHTVYDTWKSSKNTIISDDGKWLCFEINPQVGDGMLIIYNTTKKTYDTLVRAYDAKFFATNEYLVFKIKPQHEVVRKAKIDKKKPDDMPKDSLGFFRLSDKQFIKLANIKSFAAVNEQKYFFAHHHKIKSSQPTAASNSKNKSKKRKKKPAAKEPVIKSDGTRLLIINPYIFKPKTTDTRDDIEYNYVSEYTLSKKGEKAAFVIQKNVDKTDSAYVLLYSPDKHTCNKIFSFNGTVKNLTFSETGNHLAFLATADTGKSRVFDLYYWNENNTSCSKVVDTATPGMPANYSVSEFCKLFFSEDGQRLYLGTALKPEKETKDTLPEDEKHKVDIWNWQDKRLQTQQLNDLEKDLKKNYLAVYHVQQNKFVQLCNEDIDDYRMPVTDDSKHLIGISTLPYQRTYTWDYPWKADYYIIYTQTGEKEKIITASSSGIYISPNGNYVVYYKRDDDSWNVYNILTKQHRKLNENIQEVFFEDDNGQPANETPYDLMGWSEDNKYVYIYSEFDIWKFSLENHSSPENITSATGKQMHTEFRYIKTNPDEKYIPEKNILLHSFNKINKQAGFYKIDDNKKLNKLTEGIYKLNFIAKARQSGHTVYTKMTAIIYPDILLSTDEFKTEEKISDINPQQKEFNWVQAKLIHWKSPKGKNLQGILYIPENFDSTRKYPLLVYYYEKYSDNLHNHYAPRPSASVINPTEYASNGYVVFFPDILYEAGKPGESAYDCIISGTNYVKSLGFIDETRMGLQGQSWGGYQTAWLITQTNMFKAAMAGAPVSNMTSAYGGIRWESGLSRMFQYEKSQSRLGVTLWQDREKYIKHSPVFFADKVQTPLLIMHNDNDGAVPWYQGIEYFVALRRLDKPCWMLNYNGDAHNLRKRPNQVDLSIRMRQFFDHYLLDKPMPVWMKDGLPAVKKGKINAYEYAE